MFVWGLVIVYLILKGIFSLIAGGLNEIDRAFERRADRSTIARLIARDMKSAAGEWPLPAAESWAIFRGVGEPMEEVFKLAILQLLAMRVLNLDIVIGDQSARFPGGKEETVLKRGTADDGALTGSLQAAYQIWQDTPEPKTLRAVATAARAKYVSLSGFYENVVKASLVKAGSCGERGYCAGRAASYSEYERRLPSQSLNYALGQQGILNSTGDAGPDYYSIYELTEKGTRQKDELEARLAGALRQISQRRPDWIAERPRQTLMAAIVAVAAGTSTSVAEKDAQLIEREIQPELIPALAACDDSPLYLDPITLDNLERVYYSMVNHEHDQGGGWETFAANEAGDSSGDNGDWGGDGGGGDSGGGDFGGGWDA